MNTCDRKDCSSGCFTSNFTPLLTKSPIKPRSRYVIAVLIFFPSCVVATIIRSSIVASRICLALTSSRKSEYGIGVAPLAIPRPSNCLKTVNSTNAITTQMAAFENMLFTRTPWTRTAPLHLAVEFDFTAIIRACWTVYQVVHLENQATPRCLCRIFKNFSQ